MSISETNKKKNNNLLFSLPCNLKEEKKIERITKKQGKNNNVLSVSSDNQEYLVSNPAPSTNHLTGNQKQEVLQATGRFLLNNNPSMLVYFAKQICVFFIKACFFAALIGAGFLFSKLMLDLVTLIIIVLSSNILIILLFCLIAWIVKNREDAKLKDCVRILSLQLKALKMPDNVNSGAKTLDSFVSLSTYLGRLQKSCDEFLKAKKDIKALLDLLSNKNNHFKNVKNSLDNPHQLSKKEIKEIKEIKAFINHIKNNTLQDSLINTIGVIAKMSLLNQALLSFTYIPFVNKPSLLSNILLVSVFMFFGLVLMTIYAIFKIYYYLSNAVTQYRVKKRIKAYLKNDAAKNISSALRHLGEHIVQHTHPWKNSAWGCFRFLKGSGECGTLASTLYYDGLWSLPSSTMPLLFALGGALVSGPYALLRCYSDYLDYQQAEKFSKLVQMLVAVKTKNTDLDNCNKFSEQEASHAKKLQKKSLLLWIEKQLGKNRYKDFLDSQYYTNTNNFYNDIITAYVLFKRKSNKDIANKTLTQKNEIEKNEIEKNAIMKDLRLILQKCLLKEIRKTNIDWLINDAFTCIKDSLNKNNEDINALAKFFNCSSDDIEAMIKTNNTLLNKELKIENYLKKKVVYDINSVIKRWITAPQKENTKELLNYWASLKIPFLVKGKILTD